MQDIKYLFEPRSVAVLGASSEGGKLGNTLVSNLIFSKYKGKIYPINPSGGEILGLHAYKDVGEVPGEIDLAVIVIPAALVFEAVKSCADKGVKFVAIITSGFSEIGNAEEERKNCELCPGARHPCSWPEYYGRILRRCQDECHLRSRQHRLGKCCYRDSKRRSGHCHDRQDQGGEHRSVCHRIRRQ